MLSAMNKADCPATGGRQMPSHFGSVNLNMPTQSSPTGTQYLQAVGTANSIKKNSDSGIVFVSSGDGTTAQGAYHEALNWAAKDLLPVVFVIENNHFAISVPLKEQIAGESIEDISSGYKGLEVFNCCLLYTSPSPRDATLSRMPSSA